MFNVCLECGQYSVEKRIDRAGPLDAVAVCPYCGHTHPFVQLPLFIVTGASGAGKTTAAIALVPALRREAVVLDADILWGLEFVNPDGDYRRFRELWLRIAKNISQSGLPVILTGTFLPDQIEDIPERRYFSQVHFLGLVADDSDMIRRLHDRPEWRRSGADGFIDDMIRFNGWLKSSADQTTPPIRLVDTSVVDLEQTTKLIVAWFRSHMGNE